MTTPLSTSGAFWGYRTDLVDKPIESIEQLLEPRFKGKLCVPFPVNLTGLLMLTLTKSGQPVAAVCVFGAEMRLRGAALHSSRSQTANAACDISTPPAV